MRPFHRRTVMGSLCLDGAARTGQIEVDADLLPVDGQEGDGDAVLLFAGVVIDAGCRAAGGAVAGIAIITLIQIKFKIKLRLGHRQSNGCDGADGVVGEVVVFRFDAEDVSTGVICRNACAGGIGLASHIRSVRAANGITCGDAGVAGVGPTVIYRSGARREVYRHAVSGAVISKVGKRGGAAAVGLGPIGNRKRLLADAPRQIPIVVRNAVDQPRSAVGDLIIVGVHKRLADHCGVGARVGAADVAREA